MTVCEHCCQVSIPGIPELWEHMFGSPDTRAPSVIYIRWSDDGQHIRKWDRKPFDGATPYTAMEKVQ